VTFFRKFSQIIGKYCLSARRISSGRFVKGDFFSEIFANYWKILSGGARRQISAVRFFKGDLFSEIFGNYRKFSEIIGKYCLSARRISADRFSKGDFFFGNFRKLLENIVGVRDESLQTVL